MFAMTSCVTSSTTTSAAVRPRNATHSRRAVTVVTRAASSDDESTIYKKPKTYSSEQLKGKSNAASSALSAPVTPVKFKAEIDPADGSVAYAAPLGDDNTMFSSAMVAFKEPRAIEVINGRVAMIGWMAALSAEIFDEHSLSRQMFKTRTFTLADGVVDTVTSPAAGLFLIPAVVMAVVAASLAPSLRNNAENGLDEVPQDFFMFKASSEMTNGRAAMVGLVSLLVAENFTGGNPLF